MNKFTRLGLLVMLFGGVHMVPSPVRAGGYFEQLRERAEHALGEADPFVSGSTANRLTRNFDEGTLPFRHAVAEGAVTAAEDYGRVQMGLPPSFQGGQRYRYHLRESERHSMGTNSSQGETVFQQPVNSVNSQSMPLEFINPNSFSSYPLPLGLSQPMPSGFQ